MNVILLYNQLQIENELKRDKRKEPMTNLNEWFASTIHEAPVRKALICKDGTSLSVQASNFHCCYPRIDNAVKYEEVEVWQVTSKVPNSWLEYGDPEDNPFSCIPVKLVEEFIDSHGGIKKTVLQYT